MKLYREVLNLPQHEDKLDCGTVVLGGSSKALREALALAADQKICLVTSTSAFVTESPILTDDFTSYLEYYDNLITLISKVQQNANIKILRNTSVESSEPLRLTEHAVYVDQTKCDGCGDCIKACPVNILDLNESGLVDMHPVARKLGEGEDAGVTITRLSQPYCQASCPIAMDARGYVGCIADGEVEQANEVIARTNPLPEVCGKICTHPCEATCARTAMDEPVQVRNIKRYAAEKNTACFELAEKRNNDESKKIAVIGSGPAGLAAAADLAAWGYPVTIFEALSKAGGMLKVGIPEFRLSDETLQKELENIIALGVDIKTNSPIGKDLTINQLLSDHGYKSVFICVGAHESTKLRIEGEDLPDVHAGVEFLRELNLGNTPEVGKKVVVIGGGNVAIDAARSARRLGAESVAILYRRTRAEMPAYAEEVEQALEEGIKIEFLAAPTKIVNEGGLAIECIKMELGEPDESGRRRPVPVEGSDFTVDADTVITAIGQGVRPDFMKGIGDLKLNPNGTIAVEESTCATSMVGVYAGGDGSRGPASVIEAIADGKNAAVSIDHALSGTGERATGTGERATGSGERATGSGQRVQGTGSLSENYYLNGETKPTESQMIKLAKYQNQLSARGSEGQRVRVGVRELGIEERVRGFDEVELGLGAEEAVAEAKRCLGCRLCIGCGICKSVCPKEAIDFTMINRGIEVEGKRSLDYSVASEKYILPSMKELYQHSYNVVTATELESMLNPDGAYGGLIMRSYDGDIPKKIVFVDIGGSKNVKRKTLGSEDSIDSKGTPSPERRAPNPEKLGSIQISRLASYVKKNYPGCAVKLFKDNTETEETKELGEDAVQVPDLAIEEDPEAHTFVITYTQGEAEERYQADLIVLASIFD
jgi:NADPH-dependent glutamate synthase beta subunit-like oxidoreductase